MSCSFHQGDKQSRKLQCIVTMYRYNVSLAMYRYNVLLQCIVTMYR